MPHALLATGARASHAVGYIVMILAVLVAALLAWKLSEDDRS